MNELHSVNIILLVCMFSGLNIINDHWGPAPYSLFPGYVEESNNQLDLILGISNESKYIEHFSQFILFF